jgi:cell wall-associated NlpC family hydrolase
MERLAGRTTGERKTTGNALRERGAAEKICGNGKRCFENGEQGHNMTPVNTHNNRRAASLHARTGAVNPRRAPLRGLRAAASLALLFALSLMLGACSFLNTSTVEREPKSAPASKIVATAKSQLGKPYRNAGESPDTGFDCSGLVQWTYAQYGIRLPRTTSDQYQVGKYVPKNALSPGDLVFFQIGSRHYDSMHVGIYAGGGEFIHSPSPGGRVREEQLNSPYWESYYLGAKRVAQ